MERTMLGLLALLLGVSTASAGDRTQKRTGPIPKQYAKETAVCLELENWGKKDDHHTMSIRLANPTDTPVVFTGYSEQMPRYRIQKWVDGKWVDHRVGWFGGTKLRTCIIPSSRSSVITVLVKDTLFPLRVGIEYTNEKMKKPRVVWSAKLDKDKPNAGIAKPAVEAGRPLEKDKPEQHLQPGLSLGTPRQTVASMLAAMATADVDTAVRCLDPAEYPAPRPFVKACFAELKALGGLKGYDIVSESREGDEAEVKIKFRFKHGRDSEDSWDLKYHKDKRQWLLGSM